MDQICVYRGMSVCMVFFPRLHSKVREKTFRTRFWINFHDCHCKVTTDVRFLRIFNVAFAESQQECTAMTILQFLFTIFFRDEAIDLPKHGQKIILSTDPKNLSYNKQLILHYQPRVTVHNFHSYTQNTISCTSNISLKKPSTSESGHPLWNVGPNLKMWGYWPLF